MTLRRVAWIAAAASVFGAAPLPAPAEPPPVSRAIEDTAPPDSAAEEPPRRSASPGDTLPSGAAVSDTLPGRAPEESPPADEARADTAPPPRRYFPPAAPSVEPAGATIWECDRRCILDRNPLVLADLLDEALAGYTFLRAGQYGGPHHVRDGVLGPGVLTVRENGRRLVPLEGGQVDLSRIPVARMDRVRVTRGPHGLEVDVRGLRHSEPEAYTRVNAGTGSPGINLIRGTFTNGLGRRFAVSTGVDLLNSDALRAGSDRLDFWGSVAFMPAGEETGVELQWRNQNLDREQPETLEIRRRDVYLQGRTRLAGVVDVDVSVGRSRWELRNGDEEGEETLSPVEAEGGSLTLQAGAGRTYLMAGVDTWDGDAFPSVRGSVDGGLAVGPRLSVSAGGELGVWDSFDAASVHGGIEYRAGLGADLRLGLSGATGVRGFSRPRAGAPDSVSFSELTATASARLGPLDVSGRGSYQDVSRQVPFGDPFDGSLTPRPGLSVAAVGGSLEGPVLPLDWLLPGVRPIRVSAGWRHQESVDASSEATPLYLPRDQYRIAAVFREDFFQGDLELRAELGGRYRTEMFTAQAGEETPVPVDAWFTFDGNAMVKLKDVRIWWRGGNLRGVPWQDLSGVPQPANRAAFGISWEFFN